MLRGGDCFPPLKEKTVIAAMGFTLNAAYPKNKSSLLLKVENCVRKLCHKIALKCM